MNILITSFSFPNFKDGIYDGKFVFSEALAYAENGAHVRVLTPHYDNADKIEDMHDRMRVMRFQYFIPKSFQVLKKPGIPVYNQKSFLAIIQIPLLCLLFVLHILKHARWAHIIHAQWTLSALLALPAKWILGSKIAVTARGSDLRLLPQWMNRFVHRKVDAAIDCFGPIPWNVENKRNFPAHYIKLPHMVHYDPSGAIPDELKHILQGSEDPFIVLYVGRFDFIKMNENKLPLIDLIYASDILRAKSKRFHVLFVGDGEETIREKMLRAIKEYDLQPYVTLLGQKTNVPDYVDFCHIGVGGIAFNGVSQEFTISGKPQILISGPDNDGTPWRHGTNAILVKPNDAKDLAEKLNWAMENRDQLEEIGIRAKGEMSQYIIDSRTGGKLYLRAFQRLVD